ncbi:MAG: hypothetical protein D6698_16755 [Gammaproteobacteria bacterium]|nr:MAG: hypothetical protein D6698_16755 [Gammaproteobacteria bacterium]
MERLAFGWLSMSEEEFYNSTLRSFHNRLKGFEEREQSRQREDWTRTRWMILHLLSPHVKRTTFASLRRALRFPWEIEEERKKVAHFKGDVSGILAKWDAEMKSKKGNGNTRRS